MVSNRETPQSRETPNQPTKRQQSRSRFSHLQVSRQTTLAGAKLLTMFKISRGEKQTNKQTRKHTYNNSNETHVYFNPSEPLLRYDQPSNQQNGQGPTWPSSQWVRSVAEVLAAHTQVSVAAALCSANSINQREVKVQVRGARADHLQYSCNTNRNASIMYPAICLD